MTDQEIKDLITAELAVQLKKVRIPELTENTTELDGTFKTVLYNPHNNKTQWESLQDLQTYFALGGDGTGSAGDAARTGRYIFQLSDSYAGQNTVSLPQYAGKNFTVRIDTLDLLDSEYTVLNAGGFKVDIPGYTFQGGERITIDSGEPIADGSTPQVGGGLIKGTLVVSVNTSLSADDMRKLVQVRGGFAQVTVTLPDLAAVSDNDYLFIETHLSNTKQQKISTTGGQSIYLNSTSKTALYLAPGEVVVLYRKSDGWYPLNDFATHYSDIGHPVARYSVGANELVLKGQQVAKADYPRLYEAAQTFGGGFISKTTYDANPERYRGCYVEISTTHFQLPNLMNMALRGLESESGTDTNRTYNAAGGYQGDSVGAHTHPYRDRYAAERNNVTGGATYKENMPTNYNGNLGQQGDTDNNQFLYYDTTTSSNTGEETVMKNVGIFWVTKI